MRRIVDRLLSGDTGVARTAGTKGEATWATIRKSAIKLIYKHGYAAMNLRQLAVEAGLRPGSLYNYFQSKEEFLFRILREILEEILADFDRTVGPITATPVDRLLAFVEFHIRWHTERRLETFIGFMEMRSLSKARYLKYVALRKRYEDCVTDILTQGMKAGQFSIRDPRVTAFAIISMLTGTCQWYRKNGRLAQAELIGIYKDIVLKIASPAPGTQRRSARVSGS
jgi:AcrR family transcriptional regulator